MPLKYNIVAPGQPYIQSVFPGPLAIPPATTNIQAQNDAQAASTRDPRIPQNRGYI